MSQKPFAWSLFILGILVLAFLPLACSSSPTPSNPNPSAPTNTPVNTATQTPTSTTSNTATQTATNTASNTATPSATHTATGTPTNSPTSTSTSTPTSTPPYDSPITMGVGYLNQPEGISFASAGNLWVVNYGSSNLQKWVTGGSTPITEITSFNSTSFSNPIGGGLDPATGNAYVADRSNARIEVFNSTGNYLTQITGLSSVSDVTVNSTGTTLYALQQGGPCNAYSITAGSPPTYTFRFAFANSGAGQVSNTFDVAMDSHDNIWIADFGSHRAVKYDPAGAFQQGITLANSGQDYGVAVDGSDNVFLSDGLGNDLVEFNSSGQQINTFGAGIGTPFGLAFDSSYNHLYVSYYSPGEVIGFLKQ